MARCSITLPMLALAVCSVSADATTDTLSLAAPTSSTTSTTIGVLICTVLPLRVKLLKPADSTFTE